MLCSKVAPLFPVENALLNSEMLCRELNIIPPAFLSSYKTTIFQVFRRDLNGFLHYNPDKEQSSFKRSTLRVKPTLAMIWHNRHWLAFIIPQMSMPVIPSSPISCSTYGLKMIPARNFYWGWNLKLTVEISMKKSPSSQSTEFCCRHSIGPYTSCDTDCTECVSSFYAHKEQHIYFCKHASENRDRRHAGLRYIASQVHRKSHLFHHRTSSFYNGIWRELHRKSAAARLFPADGADSFRLLCRRVYPSHAPPFLIVFQHQSLICNRKRDAQLFQPFRDLGNEFAPALRKNDAAIFRSADNLHDCEVLRESNLHRCLDKYLTQPCIQRYIPLFVNRCLQSIPRFLRRTPQI